jgi:hypothetical protein
MFEKPLFRMGENQKNVKCRTASDTTGDDLDSDSAELWHHVIHDGDMAMASLFQHDIEFG